MWDNGKYNWTKGSLESNGAYPGEEPFARYGFMRLGNTRNTALSLTTPNKVALVSSWLVIILGAAVLTGWVLDIGLLKSILPAWPKVHPATALGFILAGFSLAGVVTRRENFRWPGAAKIVAVLVVLLGMFKVGDYLLGWNLNFDLLGFKNNAPAPAQMALFTAMNFVLLGCALFLAGDASSIKIYQLLVFSAAAIGWLGFAPYIYGATEGSWHSQMAFTTALLFEILSIGLLCARTDGGLMALLVSDSQGGLLARRLLLPALLLPLAITWFESLVKQLGWLSLEAKSALFMLDIIVVLGALVWFNAVLLHRADVKRKEAEKKENQLAKIVEGSDDAIISKTLDGVITSWNQSAERIFGYTSKEAVGQPMLMIFPTERLNEEIDILARIARGETVEHFETIRVTKSGKLIDVSATISPIHDENGKIIGASKIARDITVQRKLEAQYRHAQKMEGIGQLAGGVAHDFNNILAIIEMQSGLMESPNLTADQWENLDEIKATVQRAASLTRQLLLFSRREVFQPRDLDWSESVTNTTKMLRRILGENIQVQLKLASQPMFIHADASMMDQVLMNLCVNARDAMPNGGQLYIEIAHIELDEFAAKQSPQMRPGSFVRLSVSDSGCGIEPEILPRIFEPFFTTKDVGKGTGLGLATVFGIVQQHQGWVNVYSEVHHGTTFRVYLPRLAANASPKTAHPAFTAMRGGHETILLVEDDQSLRASIRKALSQLGYHILEASTGVKGLEVWKENRDAIDLLLTDLVMPDRMTGRDLAQCILQENPKLKIIYMSGYSAEVVDKEFPLNEGVNFLTKPFQAIHLVETIRKVLDASP